MLDEEEALDLLVERPSASPHKQLQVGRLEVLNSLTQLDASSVQVLEELELCIAAVFFQQQFAMKGV